MKLHVYISILSIFGTIINAANILGIWPVLSKSHFSLGLALFEKLAENGHTITFISPYEHQDSHSNIKFIKLDGAVAAAQLRNTIDSLEMRKLSAFQSLLHIVNVGEGATDFTLSHPKLQEVLKSDEKFDLLIIDVFLDDALLAIAHYLKIPAMTFSSAGASRWSDEMVKNPLNPSYNPNMFLDQTDEMNFIQRLMNSLATIVDQISYHWLYLPSQERILKKHFTGLMDPLPRVIDLIHDVKLVLLNSHPLCQCPRAHVPNSIEVGGMHLKTSEEQIHPEFFNIMNKAVNGIIYFSMGGNIKSSDLPMEIIDAFVKVFASMKDVLVLWKFESVALKDKHSGNVIIGPWMPQQEILKHKNLKVFITHGGLLSSMEAIYYGKPIIGIPIFNDQRFNMARAVKQNYGIKLDYDKISENSVRNAIETVFNDTSYQENAEKLSVLFKDNPIKPIDKAAYYVEHVLRTNATHLKSIATKLTFWQIHLIDQVIFVILLIASVISITIFALSRAMKFMKTKFQKRNKSRTTKSSTTRNKFKSN